MGYWDKPEEGCWWHALSKDGRALFESKDVRFGQQTTESRNTLFQGVRMIRFAPTRELVSPWIDAGGFLLKLSPSNLHSEDWFEWPATWDRHVRASVVLEVGELVEIG